MIIRATHLPKVWFFEYAVTEENNICKSTTYFIFLLVCMNEILHSSEIQSYWLNTCFLFENVSVLQMVLHKYLRKIFPLVFAAEPDFICCLIDATKRFTAQTNHSSTTKLFKQGIFLFVVFLMFLTDSGEETAEHRREKCSYDHFFWKCSFLIQSSWEAKNRV